jgi:hypothetical protein
MSMNRNKNNDFLQYLLDDEDDDEDHESDLQFLSLIAVQFIEVDEKQMSARTRDSTGYGQTTRTTSSNTIFVRNRLEWDLHVTQLMEEGPNAFVRLYRMEHASFVKLCRLVEPFVSIDPADVESSNTWEKWSHNS